MKGIENSRPGNKRARRIFMENRRKKRMNLEKL